MSNIVNVISEVGYTVGAIGEMDGEYYKVTRCIDRKWINSDDSLKGFDLQLERIQSEIPSPKVEKVESGDIIEYTPLIQFLDEMGHLDEYIAECVLLEDRIQGKTLVASFIWEDTMSGGNFWRTISLDFSIWRAENEA